MPEIGPNEVLIHVESAGMGQWDAFEREGGFAREFGISRSSPMCLAPMVPAPLRPSAIASRGSSQATVSTLSACLNPKGGFYAEYRRGQGGRRLADPRQADDPGGRDARGRDDRASRLG